jgi:hypothetical protein
MDAVADAKGRTGGSALGDSITPMPDSTGIDCMHQFDHGAASHVPGLHTSRIRKTQYWTCGNVTGITDTIM